MKNNKTHDILPRMKFCEKGWCFYWLENAYPYYGYM